MFHLKNAKNLIILKLKKQNEKAAIIFFDNNFKF